MTLTTSSLNGALPLTARGKVRDLYIIDANTLLFVATDRISAYDVTLTNGVPNKGRLLTLLSVHWFKVLTAAIPSLRTHFITTDLPPQIPDHLKSAFAGRSMQVRKLKTFPVEAIVRGYMTGSAWVEYKAKGTVHSIPVDKDLQESAAFPEALYTPSIKAPPGEHDENVHPSKIPELIGSAKHAKTIEKLSLQIYRVAWAYAAERGIIIADTKFEFGLDEKTDEVVLIDEVLTPDSSRFWPSEDYTVGRAQKSFDKQGLRDWLVREGLEGKEGVEMPVDVVEQTWGRYREVYERLVGEKWEEI
ncbi:MAG: hypothetical protein LQ340_006652 [Diploschistes diacapsis]|nr:MAG: hypothetical protein LQ340_006652 [Diploschistes diacapsis]